MEKNKYLVETRKDVLSYSQGYNGQLSAAYGVTDALTLSAGTLYDSVAVLRPGGFVRQDKFFGSAGAAVSAGGMFFNLQSVYDPRENAASADVSWQTLWNGWDLFAQNIYYDGVLTARNVWGNARIENDTLFRLNKNLCFRSFTLAVTVAGTTSGSNLVCAAQGYSADQFKVDGYGGASFSVSSIGSIQLTNALDGTKLTVDNFTPSCSSNCTMSGSSYTLRVGGRLTVPASATAGTYTGTYPVTITY